MRADTGDLTRRRPGAVRRRKVAGSLASVVFAFAPVTFALAGCGAEEPPPAPAAPPVPAADAPLPPRAAELRLDGIDPCALLTQPQLSLLGIPDRGARAANSDLLGSNTCLWAASSQMPHGSPQATAITREGVEYFRTPTDVVIDIDGQPALEATSPDLDPATHCLVLVDVAAGQTLWVQYSSEGQAMTGSTHQIACDRTRDLAKSMVATLRGLQQR